MDRSHWSQTPGARLVSRPQQPCPRPPLWSGQRHALGGKSRYMAKPRDPQAYSGSRPELAPLGLDSGTRGYNPRCRDTVALPPSISLEWAKARVEREKADIWLNPRARRRGRRDPGRGWALQAFIKTPAPLPHPSSPPAPGPGPGTVFRAAHFRRFFYRETIPREANTEL